ncbi:N-acetylmuramoyl-L-alanine amidase-like domain-containing protein [Okeania sp.]|uniref:N-acetylmuramoyl-L-alanine amidase-like domain-containing protein n=1 Tax=Okeania sp. TaxID=3100323 RepID=UPI002B4ADFF8|nr:N-acetylmuramoyl-L-alanine amidase-like domain-containing protein [Okeania sp.]MEB3341501.1 N-acetylmuramoyl-L-alanine amidase-like domain-containing protein [Okeania sp.]
MRKLLKLTILTVAVTGFYTVNFPLLLNSSMSFLSLVNAAQKDENIQSEQEKEINQIPSNKIPEDPKFKPVMEYAIKHNLAELSMAEIMQAIADYFIGTPYKAGLLDKSNQESLVISLDGFDCVLFVETVLALSRGIAIKDYSYLTFVNHIIDQRYSEGKIDGYCSRLHYFSGWIADNQKRGNVRDIGFELGGKRLNKQFFFMSKNRWSYPQISGNNKNYQCIVNMEDSISQLKTNYIPYDKISSIYSQLKPGDIIALATEINGLDVTHTGLVYRNFDGNIGLIHASPSGKVTVAYDLAKYIWNVESAIGILVARPVDPGKVVGE